MPFERLHGKKPSQEFVPFGEMQNGSFLNACGVCSVLEKSEDWKRRADGTRKPSASASEIDRRQLDRGQAKSSQIQFPFRHLPFCRSTSSEGRNHNARHR